MIKIYDFDNNHIEVAHKIAVMNYNDECTFVPALPPLDKLPGLEDYAKSNLGVVAMEGDKLLGFLC